MPDYDNPYPPSYPAPPDSPYFQTTNQLGTSLGSGVVMTGGLAGGLPSVSEAPLTPVGEALYKQREYEKTLAQRRQTEPNPVVWMSVTSRDGVVVLRFLSTRRYGWDMAMRFIQEQGLHDEVLSIAVEAPAAEIASPGAGQRSIILGEDRLTYPGS
jgi:hypothetical protein